MLYSSNGSIYAQQKPSLIFEKTDGFVSKEISNNPAIKQSTHVELNFKLFDEIEKREIQKFAIPGFEEEFYPVTINKIIHSTNGGWSATGFTEGNRLNSFVLSYFPKTKKAYISITIPENHIILELRYEPSQNVHLLLKKDPDQNNELICKLDDQLFVEAENEIISNSVTNQNEGPSVIDVMIVYTENAKEWAETFSSGIENIVNQSMAVAQTSVDNTELEIEFRLVYSQEVDYTESGNSVLDLQRLTASPTFNPWGQETSGFLDEVHQLREIYGADLVALFTETSDVGGIAWVITSESGLPNMLSR